MSTIKKKPAAKKVAKGFAKKLAYKPRKPVKNTHTSGGGAKRARSTE